MQTPTESPPEAGVFDRALGAAKAAAIGLAEQGLVPDRLVRIGIRRLLQERLAELRTDDHPQRLLRGRSHAARRDRDPRGE